MADEKIVVEITAPADESHTNERLMDIAEKTLDALGVEDSDEK